VTLPPSITGLSFARPFHGRLRDAFVAGDRRDGLAEVRRRHLEGQRHEALQERAVVGQRAPVLLFAHQHDFVLLRRGDAVLLRDVLCGLQHRVPTERVAAEVVEHPVLGGAGAAGSSRVRVVQVRAVRRAVAIHDERRLGHAAFDFLHGGQQRAYAGGAGLHQRRAACALRADHPRQPGKTVERVLLRHREAEYAVIEALGVDVALLQLVARDVRGELDAIQVREAALPAGEGRAPVGSVRDFGAVFHAVSSSCSPMATMKA